MCVSELKDPMTFPFAESRVVSSGEASQGSGFSKRGLLDSWISLVNELPFSQDILNLLGHRISYLFFTSIPPYSSYAFS